ncbi:MAG: carbon starvation protein A [Acidobacteriota bacterium]|nr:carbon starvation protein A [Acidobacteriota bacterium]MDH3785055.1 carbon starvation protein A [Acidobacteriota bacterium]
MIAALAVLACLAVYALGYAFYSRYIGRQVFGLRADVRTPAHVYEDGIDYVPSSRWVLFGHHFASITGLSPMLGPAIAVIWGWLPAMIWVVVGAVTIGCVHDFGALVVSVRSRGRSIGSVAEGLMGRRAKSLLHAIIFFGIALAMGVFVFVIAQLFTPKFYPQSISPSVLILVLALWIGWRTRRTGQGLGSRVGIAFVVVLVGLWFSDLLAPSWTSVSGWIWLLLAYAWIASVLPVWSLLQPRDFLNSLLLYLGLACTYLGFFVLRPEFAAPAVDLHPEGAPPMLPFVFVVVACGAASGFHSLVSSGTTAKQLDRETDARFIGYGGMLGESILGLSAVLACTAGFASRDLWSDHYRSWGAMSGLGSKMAAFIDGAATFVSQLGLPRGKAETLIAVMVVSFALTTLDSATRLLRYNIEEVGETLRFRPLANRYVSSTAAVLAIAFFAFYKVDGQSAGLALWQLFGSVNQLLAGLALLVVVLYLTQRKRPRLVYLIPMVFMMASTTLATGFKLVDYYRGGQTLLLVVGSIISLMAIALVVEAVISIRRYRRQPPVADLDIELEDSPQT